MSVQLYTEGLSEPAKKPSVCGVQTQSQLIDSTVLAHWVRANGGGGGGGGY